MMMIADIQNSIWSSLLERETQSLISGLHIYHVLALVAIVCVIYDAMRRRQKPEPKVKSPPGPWGVPVLGNLLQLGRKPHETLTNYREKYGDVFQITMGSRKTVVLNGLETIRTALIRHAEDFAGRPDFYTFNFIASGKSMGFGDYGPRWKLHRRLAQNALSLFVNSKHNPMETAIQEEADQLVANLSGSKEPVDPHDEVCSTSVVLKEFNTRADTPFHSR